MLPGGMWGESQVVASLRARRAVTGRARRARCSPGSSAGAARRRCRTAARALKRPLWDVLDRLARVGAVTLRVEPPDTEAGDPHRAGGRARRRPAHAARARRAVPARAQAAAAVRGARSGWAAARSSGTSPASSASRRRSSRTLERRGLVRIDHAERAARPVRGLPGGRRRRRPDRRPAGGARGGRGARTRGRRAPVRRYRQRQDAGVPRGGARGCWRGAAAPSCWSPRSGSRRRR